MQLSYPTLYQSISEGKFLFFEKEPSRYAGFFSSGFPFLPFHYGYCWNHEHSFSRETKTQRKLYFFKLSGSTQKSKISIANEESGLAFINRDLGNRFVSKLIKSFEHCEKKMTSQIRICWLNCPHTLSHDIRKPDWVKFCWRHKRSIDALLSLCFSTNSWRH